MKIKNLLLLFATIIFGSSYGQQWILEGKISLQSSAGKGIEQVNISSKGTKVVKTNQNGEFKLTFSDRKDSQIKLIVSKDGYEVVNQRSVYILTQKTQAKTNIYLEKVKTYEENRSKIAQAIEIQVNVRYELQKEDLQPQSADYEEKMELLNKQKQAIISNLNWLSKWFTQVNLDEQNELFKSTYKLFENQEYTNAIAALEASKIAHASKTASAKSSANIYIFKAMLYIADFQLDSVETNFQTAIQKSTENVEYQLLYSDFLIRLKNASQAIPLLKKALAIAQFDFDRAKIYSDLGIIYSDANEFELSQQNFTQAIPLWQTIAANDSAYFELEYCKVLMNNAILYKQKLESKPNPNDFSNAQKIVEKAILILKKYNNSDLAQSYLNTALSMREYFTRFPVGKIETLRNAEEYKKIADNLVENQGSLDSARYNYLKATVLYEEMITQDTANIAYMLNTALIYQNLNQIEGNNDKCIENQARIIYFYEKIYKQYGENSDLRKNLSDAYAKNAWYLLIAQQVKKAKYNALKAYITDNSQEWLKSIVALCYLFNNEYDKARAIYVEYKNKPIENQTFKELFLQSFIDIEEYGITHPDIAKARLLLSE